MLHEIALIPGYWENTLVISGSTDRLYSFLIENFSRADLPPLENSDWRLSPKWVVNPDVNVVEVEYVDLHCDASGRLYAIEVRALSQDGEIDDQNLLMHQTFASSLSSKYPRLTIAHQYINGLRTEYSNSVYEAGSLKYGTKQPLPLHPAGIEAMKLPITPHEDDQQFDLVDLMLQEGDDAAAAVVSADPTKAFQVQRGGLVWTALHWASYLGYVETAQQLLAAGADPLDSPHDQSGSRRFRPLTIAAVQAMNNGDAGLFSLLLEHSDHQRKPVNYIEAVQIVLQPYTSGPALDAFFRHHERLVAQGDSSHEQLLLNTGQVTSTLFSSLYRRWIAEQAAGLAQVTMRHPRKRI